MTSSGIGTLIPTPQVSTPKVSTPAPISTAVPRPVVVTPPSSDRSVPPRPSAVAGWVTALWRRRRLLAVTVIAVSAAALWASLDSRDPLPDGPFGVLAASGALLVIVFVAVPAHRSARRLLPEFHPAAAVERRLGIPAVEVDSAEPTIALAFLGIAAALGENPSITLVQCTGPATCDLSVDLVAAEALLGHTRERVDLTPGSPAGAVSDSTSDIVRIVRTRVLDRDDVVRLTHTPGPTVLVVETAGARWPDLLRARRLLDAIGCEVVAVAIWIGRIPPDPAHSWDPQH